MSMLLISLQTIGTITLSGITVVILASIILALAIIYRKNRFLKILDNEINKINKLDFSNVEILNENKIKCFIYDEDFFNKTKIKEFTTPVFEILSGQIIFTNVLDFKKIYMEKSVLPKESYIYFLNDKIIHNNHEYDFKNIVQIFGIYEANKNAIFLEFKFYDKKNNFKIQIVDYEALYIIDQVLKKFKTR